MVLQWKRFTHQISLFLHVVMIFFAGWGRTLRTCFGNIRKLHPMLCDTGKEHSQSKAATRPPLSSPQVRHLSPQPRLNLPSCTAPTGVCGDKLLSAGLHCLGAPDCHQPRQPCFHTSNPEWRARTPRRGGKRVRREGSRRLPRGRSRWVRAGADAVCLGRQPRIHSLNAMLCS